MRQALHTMAPPLKSLPAFLLAVFVFYWSLPLMVLLYTPTIFARFKGPRNDTHAW